MASEQTAAGQPHPSDDDILDAIFAGNAEIALPTTFGMMNNVSSNSSCAQDVVRIDDATLIRLRQLEQDAVGLAEQNDLAGAYAKLTSAIEMCPVYASAYNNRAQVLRLQNNDDAAYEDLSKAIDLAIQSNTNQTLKQAYTQRAILRKKRGDVAGADEDFAKGAQLGNEIAKVMVKNNPYAKLCNAMVSEAMARLVDQQANTTANKQQNNS